MEKQNNPDVLSQIPGARKLLEDREGLEALLRSPDTRALLTLLEQQAGGRLQQAADAAGRGDVRPLMNLVDQLQQSREGAAAVERFQKTVPGP
ncbi:MAG TPA: hypothetical protein H9714_01290 [Candidatus Flavonifractor intestinipullorum]|uniref:Uncharacterized protein n=1 Tax=Candidatus Flavonifractor intestinipullorum TaxID=2838587 RepID=A0A9D2M8L9_9FIRM|nr:hypothetical protein [Candidatus Flavonifractor intestinipullorum]